MALHDPISDFLTRLRNAKAAKHRYVDQALSKVKLALAKVLHEQGFIDQFSVDEEERSLRIFLRYQRDREPLIDGLKRVSKPGLRRYLGYREIPRVRGGIGIAILSTPKGIMEGEKARRERLGGELLCIIW
jgi:small subunit ribosomal protein S8